MRFMNPRSFACVRGLVPAAIVLAFALGALLHAFRGSSLDSNSQYHAVGADDAYISYRYAWNLVQTGALSWNASGFRHTEGFTNPLWVYLSALPALSRDKDLMYPFMAGASAALVAALLLLLLRAVSARDGAAGLVGPALCAVAPVLWAHATSGLESAVFGLVIAVMAYLTISEVDIGGRRTIMIVLACLAVWLRSDGSVYLAFIIAAAFILRAPYRWTLLTALAASLSALLVWRWLVFHAFPFPNTYYAKVNAGLMDRWASGLRCLVKVFVLKGLWVFPVAAITGLRLTRDKRFPAAMVILAGWTAYFVHIGGDAFLERHLLGVMILSAALGAGFWRRMAREAGRWRLASAGCIVIVSIAQPMLLGDGRFRYLEGKPRDPLIMLGKAVEADRSRFGILVSGPAGKLPFFAGGDCIDPIGLNDPDLARIGTPRFQPGHSSGSMDVALALARQRGPASYFTFFPVPDSDNRNRPVRDRGQVLLWMDNENPGSRPLRALSEGQWDQALRDRSTNWSVIARAD
jgi:arabinofuranosyltransferase